MTSKVAKITQVSCRDECISCAACVRIAPSVFRLDATTNLAKVTTDNFCGLETQILLARDTCPVCNITVDVEGGVSQVIFRMATVASINFLTRDVIELALNFPSFSFSPGQYVSFKMWDRAGDFFRAYSVVDFKKECIRFCIKLEPHGRAAAIFSQTKVGGKLYVSEAKGVFSLSENGLEAVENIMVATGTGVAPILAMAKATSGFTTILVGFRSEADILYLEEFQQLPNVRVKVILSKPSEAWKGLRGRVTDHLESLSFCTGRQIYICGQEAMIQTVSTKLEGMGFKPKNIFTEAYDSAPPVTHKVPLWQVPISKWSSSK